jgi:predicted porin
MKKILLGTSALVAAGLVSSQAMAVDPIKIAVTGYVSSVFVFGGQSHTPDRFDTVKWDGEIHFSGETKLDNGMKVGVQVELEAFTVQTKGTLAGDQIDEHFMWFDGAFGRVEVGATNGPGNKLHVFSPSVMPSHGVDTPDYFHFATPGWSAAALWSTAPSDLRDLEDANKISYFSPAFGPFKFGISYTPEFQPGLNGNTCGSTGGFGGQYGVCTTHNPGQWQHAIEGGGRFDFDLNGVAIAWSLGGLYASPEIHNSDYTNMWRFASGLSVTFNNFTIGGAYRWTNSGYKGKYDNVMFGLGGTYTSGPWGFSLAWAQVRDQDGGHGNKTDVLNFVDGGVVYNLGPGVDVFAGAQYARFTGDCCGGPQSSALKGYFGSKLTF